MVRAAVAASVHRLDSEHRPAGFVELEAGIPWEDMRPEALGDRDRAVAGTDHVEPDDVVEHSTPSPIASLPHVDRSDAFLEEHRVGEGVVGERVVGWDVAGTHR